MAVQARVKLAYSRYNVGDVIPEMPAMLFEYLNGRGFVESFNPGGEVIQSEGPIAKPKQKSRKKQSTT
jgi:hypothetical protein